VTGGLGDWANSGLTGRPGDSVSNFELRIRLIEFDSVRLVQIDQSPIPSTSTLLFYCLLTLASILPYCNSM